MSQDKAQIENDISNVVSEEMRSAQMMQLLASTISVRVRVISGQENAIAPPIVHAAQGSIKQPDHIVSDFVTSDQ